MVNHIGSAVASKKVSVIAQEIVEKVKEIDMKK